MEFISGYLGESPSLPASEKDLGEWVDAVNSAGLEGQKKFMNPERSEHQHYPFRKLSEREMDIVTGKMQDNCKIADYDKTILPLQAVRLAQEAVAYEPKDGHQLMVHHTGEGSLVAIIDTIKDKDHSWMSDDYLICRFGKNGEWERRNKELRSRIEMRLKEEAEQAIRDAKDVTANPERAAEYWMRGAKFNLSTSIDRSEISAMPFYEDL